MVFLTNPRMAILVSCRGYVQDKFSNREIAKDNLITVAWHSPMSFSPPMFAISIGKNRFSVELIRQSKVFCVNIMPFHLSEEVLFCGRNSGEHINKFRETGLAKEEAESIDCPLVKESIGYLECEVVDEIETGDHILFIANINRSEEKEKGKKLFSLIDDYFTTTKD